MLYQIELKDYRTFQQAFWWSREQFKDDVKISLTGRNTIFFLKEEHAVLCALQWL